MKDEKITLTNNFSIDIDSIPSMPDSELDDKLGDIERTIHGSNSAVAGYQTVSLQEAINNYAKAMNEAAIAKSTGLPVRTSSANFKGFAAEEYFKQTLKINALAKGVPDWQLGAYTKGMLPDGTTLSGIDMETDIAIFAKKHPWSKPQRTANYQSKIHDNAKLYRSDMAKAQYSSVDFVGGAGQGVNDTISIDIGGKTISSDNITPQEAAELSDAMKAQNTPEYAQGAEKQAELNRVKLGQAVTMGAATGAILTTIKEIVCVVKEKDHLSEDQWIKSIQHILCGTAEGGIRGGAIAGSVQLMSKALGKEIAENSLGAVPAMALANASVDIAKDLYRLFVTQTIDADDLLCNSVNNVFTSFAGFTGSWLGGQVIAPAVMSSLSIQGCAEVGAGIGSLLGPVGTIIGATVGGLVIGCGASLIVGTANKDAQKAFNACIEDIKSQTQLSGVDQMYYFADAMSEISEFRLSFKNLLPCYNLISDLKEYNLRKKAIKNVRAQLDSNLVAVDEAKRNALENIEQQHQQRLAMLESIFEDQRIAMYDQMRGSMETYVANSYAQYVNTFSLCQFDIASLDYEREQALESHNAILASIEHRNEANRQLNGVLDELMSDPDSATKVRPFVDRIVSEMSKDNLVVEKQYLSFDEAMMLQGGMA